MANLKPGTRVFDKPTRQWTTILKTHTAKIDDCWHVYHLVDVEPTPDYPSGWRNQREITQRG